MKNHLVLLLIFCSSIVIAQQKTVQGTVFYNENKDPVPFAYVKLKDVAFGTVTEFDGTFSLNIPSKYANETLEFSYVGYKTVSLPVSKINTELRIFLETDTLELYTVVVTASRERNPKAILKKALNRVSENFVNESFNLEGFYREYVQENDFPVKYADASFILDLKPYEGKAYKKKQLERPNDIANAQTVSSFFSRSFTLHRWHFHQSVAKGEKAKIIESKSSDDLNISRLYANIQGGPLSAITKDKVKYPANFLDKFSKYDYTLLEVEKGGKGYYLVNFAPKMSALAMEEKKRHYNIEFKLGGSLLIDKENYTIREIKYSVPPAYKNLICGYRGWNVRHFDFSVEAKYEKFNGKYALSYLKHADEFIVEDTASDRRVPYAAITEFFTHQVHTDPKVDISTTENFSNSDYNFMFEFPLDYNATYWDNYNKKYPETKIPERIRARMERKRPMEVQFASKLVRDTTMVPPIAAKKPTSIKIHGQMISDDYAWLKNKKNPKGNDQIMNYLAAENAYTDNYTRPFKKSQRDIFKELTSYIISDFKSVPTIENGYKYFYRFLPNKEYPIYYRQNIDDKSEPELLFDVNKLSEEHSYYNFTAMSVSPSNKLIAYAENTSGSDKWDLKFKNLATQKELPNKVEFIGGYEWLNDSLLLYINLEKDTYRSSKVYRYDLKTGVSTLILEESDPLFNLGLEKSRSKDFIFVTSSSSDETETHFIPIKNPLSTPRLIAERNDNHQYYVSHLGGQFYIRTNLKAPNYQLVIADTSDYQLNKWQSFIEEKEEIEIKEFLLFKKWIVLSERHELEYKLRVINRVDNKDYFISQHSQSAINFDYNPSFDTDTLSFIRTNYRYPNAQYKINMSTKKEKLLKRTANFSPIAFSKQKTVYATSSDGTKIPITLLYNKAALSDLKKEGRLPPLFIYGYGSYGSSATPSYMPNISPLLQKGVVYAIAHVRGGGELGDRWYHSGRMLNKKNSFNDFIDCTEFLINEGYGEKGKVIAQGGSAGGLLMGAIVNERPDLYGFVILDVPFVDVVNTMLDKDLPGTEQEYKEWGNPNEKKYFKYIQSYSPYDNVKAQHYPNMLFTTGMYDTRVGYWEPAKMVAKLRQLNTSDNEILLKTDFSSGHGGASGRYASLAEIALKYSMVLDYINSENQMD